MFGYELAIRVQIERSRTRHERIASARSLPRGRRDTPPFLGTIQHRPFAPGAGPGTDDTENTLTAAVDGAIADVLVCTHAVAAASFAAAWAATAAIEWAGEAILAATFTNAVAAEG